MMTDRTCRIKIDGGFVWRQSGERFHYAGTENFCRVLAPGKLAQQDVDEISRILAASQEFSGGVSETDTVVLAWCDHIRSFPLFYAVAGETLYLSDDVRWIRQESGLGKTDADSLTEFIMSGYVAASHTLYDGIKALQPGEFLLWDKAAGKLTLRRYFSYVPLPEETADFSDTADRFDAVMTDIARKIIDRHKGRRLAFPLSGGLDSRLLLCKFHELGYKDISAFTYGPAFNFEAGQAKKVAQTLGVPWRFIHLPAAQYRRMFESDERKAYWRYGDGCKAIPSMREYTALKTLRDDKDFPRDAVMINGQSGDYISGNHIAPRWYDERGLVDKNALLEVLYGKHYGLWPGLKTPENLAAIARRIEELTPLPEGAHPAAVWVQKEEMWEYDARQVCLVAHGQRSYEFFGYDWELPLWEKSVVDFFAPMPLSMKFGQKFYKDYLRRYDYKGLFSRPERFIWRWPLPMLWVVPAAKMIGLAAGGQAKKDFYARMRYFGHYSNQYAFFPFETHLKTATAARNIFSLYVRQWCVENEFPLPDDLRAGMGL